MSPSDQHTVHLLEAWHQGDREALGGLLDRNLDWIRAHVRKRLGDGMRRAGETQDFVQEAMVEVLESGPRFQVVDEAHFRRLLARIVENSIRGQHRFMHREKRDVRRERGVASDTVLRLDPAQSEVTRPSQHADREEHVAWVRLALEFLAPLDREVLWLHQYDELSFVEIATRLDMTADAVRMRFHRALPRLAKKVTELQKGQVEEVLREERRGEDS